jgi:branched-subunit amino acid ABC-type transport system permease component
MAITIWSGLVLGSIYALVATGFTISMLPTESSTSPREPS